MGVGVLEMPINIVKILDSLGSRWSDLVLDCLVRHAPSLGNPRTDSAYFRLVLYLRQIAAKSTGGRGIVAILRRHRSRIVLHQLLSLLHCESSGT